MTALRVIALLSVLALLAAMPAADAKEKRDRAQRAAFVNKYPCPATGKSRGACPGYVIAHITPLCFGGADRPSNMQWQTIAAAKAKDRRERQMCAAYRRQKQGR